MISMKLHLDNYTIEGTPEEIVEYQRLLENKEADKPTFHGVLGSMKLDESSIEEPAKELEQQLESLYSSFHDKFLKSDEAEEPTTDLQVGDSVKVLKDEGGAVGEATVSAILDEDTVHLAGYDSDGMYLDDWSHNPNNLEKLDKEKPASFGAIQAKAYLEDKSIEQVVEEQQSKYKQESRDTEADTKSNVIRNYTVDSEPTAVQYYKVEDDSYLHPTVKQGTVVKKLEEYKTTVVFATSTGLKQTIPRRHLKLLDTNVTEDRFEFAEEAGVMLTVDTDFAVECEGHHFKVTEDEYLSTFNPTDILTVRRDDGSNAITFQSFSGKAQYTILKYVKEVARPSK